ncbi:MAG: hypothetical protein NTX03_08680, partial [Bacteroidetes bacterium]|nr:hypothetical protein [Bacteroidota bacterium]
MKKLLAFSILACFTLVSQAQKNSITFSGLNGANTTTPLFKNGASNKPAKQTSYDWNGSQWNYFYTHIAQYDTAGNDTFYFENDTTTNTPIEYSHQKFGVNGMTEKVYGLAPYISKTTWGYESLYGSRISYGEYTYNSTTKSWDIDYGDSVKLIKNNNHYTDLISLKKGANAKKWDTLSKIIYAYDVNGKITSRTDYLYDASDSTWHPTQKYDSIVWARFINEKSDSNLQKSYILYTRDTTAWRPIQRANFTYSNGLADYVSIGENYTNSVWAIYSRVTHKSVDSYGSIKEITEIYDGKNWGNSDSSGVTKA